MDSTAPIDNIQWFGDLAREKVRVETIDPQLYFGRDIKWDVLRTDLLHPVCSGNKFFKLKYYLLDALQKNYTTISTSGGAWSNHIVATAFAAKACGLSAIGRIRGERPPNLSETLKEAETLGMKLEFVPRNVFPDEPGHTAGIYHIPAGGLGAPGVKGAAEMLNYVELPFYTHIACAVGTGTMLAGLRSAAARNQEVIGVAVLKHRELEKECEALLPGVPFRILHNYHFGGYAKYSPELLGMMNEFYRVTGIPTDFVYTGKLMYSVLDLIRKDFFPPGSRLLSIHSGGLQGNKSLKNGELAF
jgi:1-aminocyclopropane-1-carboxylate deaminase